MVRGDDGSRAVPAGDPSADPGRRETVAPLLAPGLAPVASRDPAPALARDAAAEAPSRPGHGFVHPDGKFVAGELGPPKA